MTLAAIAGAVQRLITTAGTFMMFPRVLHALGTDQFGVWGGVTSLVLLVTVADFGVGPAIMTLVAKAFASREQDSPRDYFTAALTMACVIAVGIGVIGALVVEWLIPRPLVAVYLLAVAGVAINVPLGSANSAWLALQRGWMVAVWDLVQTVFLIAGLALATACTDDIRAYVGAVYLALLAASALNMTVLLTRHPELRPLDLRSRPALVKRVAATGLRYFTLAILDGFSYLLDNIIALQLLGAAASAKMAIAQKGSLAALGLLMVIAQPLWPAFADAAARGDRHWIVRALVRGSFLMTSAAVAGSALIVIFGEAVLKLWLKTNVGVDNALLWTMAIWIVSISLVRVQGVLLNALGIINFQVALYSVATAIAFGLKFLLAPIYGVVGILMATAVTFPLIVLPGVLWRINRWRRDVGLEAAS